MTSSSSSSFSFSDWRKAAHIPLLIVLQIIFIILFGIFVIYDPNTAAKNLHNTENAIVNYPMFQDVHVMVFIGFGFLMTFLKKYGFSAVCLTMLISVVSIQWSILVAGFFHLHTEHSHTLSNGTEILEKYSGSGRIFLDMTHSMLYSDFAAASILISFGVVIGKTTPFQLIIMALIEIVLYTVNEVTGRNWIGTLDAGDTIFVHLFGAYFGIAVSTMLYEKPTLDHPNASSGYSSDLFSMVGTIFLWMFWPSFNAATAATGDAQHRALLNTYLSLCSCALMTFAVSALVTPRKKFTMEHIQNATLAGGVAVGASADMIVQPFGSLIIGSLAGIISTLGFDYLSPFLAKRTRLHDTCGVHNLHGMPALFGAITSMIIAAIANEETYTIEGLHEIFPLTAPNAPGGTITPGQQGVKQLIGTVITLAIALVGGAVTGLILNFLGKLQRLNDNVLSTDAINIETLKENFDYSTILPIRQYFDDELYFHVNQSYHEMSQMDNDGNEKKILIPIL